MIEQLKEFEKLSDELVALHKGRYEREKKKKEAACNLLENVVDLLVENNLIERPALQQLRKTLRELRA